ncbi:MAG: hypothetical protein ABIW84_00095 [Ilumatobacteraceae bacterium]
MSRPEADRAERIEKICFTYNQMWSMKRKMRVAAHYAVGFGAVGMGIVPDMKSGWPMLHVEDPRNVFPGPAADATSGPMAFNERPIYHTADAGGALSDCVVRKSLTGAQVRKMFGAAAQDHVPNTSDELYRPHTVWQWYDETDWVTVLDEGPLLASSSHGAQGCPWVYASAFSPSGPGGASDFEQQIGLEIAFMRLLDQKLALNDAVAWPWIFMSGYVEADPDRRLFQSGSPDAKVSVVSPPATFQVDRDMALVRDLVRTFNFESEATQGEVSGGPITGKGLVELSRATVDTVQSFFDDFAFYLPRLYATALQMDAELWADGEKSLQGSGHGETFLGSYKPSKVIAKGFGQITVEFGPGLGGFEGHLQMLQDLGADAMSVDSLMEHNPFIRSKSDEKRRIMIEKIDKLIIESSLTGQAAVPIDWLARFRIAVSDGTDWTKWLVDNPPGQETATPEDVGPVPPGALPPELAGLTGQAPGPPGGPGLQPPGMAGPSVEAPPLAALMGMG